MPPKSSNKKNTTASWYHCQMCDAHITSKVRDTHEKDCPIKEGATSVTSFPLEYIRNGILYTADLLKRSFEIEDLKEQTAKFVNNLIYISEGAIRLAGFHIGQQIQIQPTAGETPLVRAIWPIPEKFLTTVFVTNDDYDTNWQQFKVTTYKIQKLSNDSVSPAKIVNLSLEYNENEEPLTSLQVKDAARLLRLELKDLIFAIGNVITYNFYNRILKLKVDGWDGLIEKSSKSESPGQTEDLEKSFESLSLNKYRKEHFEFFKVIPITRIEIMQNETANAPIEFEKDMKNRITKDNVGGLHNQKRLIEESMNLALGRTKAAKGIKVSRTVLIYGSSGCGKTLICQAMMTTALESIQSLQVVQINASEIFSKFLGETEKNLVSHFEKAYAHYPQPTFIIVEDVHNLCPKDETNDISKRVSIAFAGMLDALSNRLEGERTFLLATTSEIDAINPNVRRCGRLDVEIEISVPSPKERAEILDCVLREVPHNLIAEHIREIAQITHGFVGADLVNLISHATLNTLKTGSSTISKDDILNSLTHVKPSAMREVLIENPNVRWSDIGGQAKLRLQLKQAIEWPLLYPEKFKRLGIKPPRGILMYGPPGCSKTMIAKALATESQLNFLSIKGPELFSMWVGESERAVREVFRKARQVAPAIVFFDEIDAIGGERAENNSNGGGSSVQERVLTQLLTELDGVEVLQNVTIVAATNRPDMIDKALLRPGRIDRIVYVGLPDSNAREEIFRIKLAKMPLAKDVDLGQLVERTDGYTGAEIQAICHEAALKTLEENLDAENVSQKHFEYALNVVQPRTSPDLLRLYEDYVKKS